MHPDRVKGNWSQLKGNIKQLWGKITFDRLKVAAGKSEYLSGRIQESHGISMEYARKQRIARGNSKAEIGCLHDTPEIELYNSPYLAAYQGSVSSILLNIKHREYP